MQKSLEKLDFIHKCELGFVYYLEHVGVDGKVKRKERIENIIPNVGRDMIMDLSLVATTWYVGLYTSAYALDANSTLALLHATGVEDDTYDTTANARLLLVPDAISNGLFSNAGTPLEFDFTTIAVPPVTIVGGFITNGQFRLNTTGQLLSAVEFASSYSIVAGETLRVTAGVQLTAV